MVLPNTLQDIRNKVRRITKSYSPQQLSNNDIDGYVNSYYLYTMPGMLRLQSLKSNYEFVTEPNQDKYDFDVDGWVSLEPPLYIAGIEKSWFQSQMEFYRLYPQNQQIDSSATGTGITGPYAFTLGNVPVLKNSLTITTVDAGGNGQTVQDDGTGVLSGDGTGTVNYLTGAVSVTFSNLVPNAEAIQSSYEPYRAGRPTSCLFFDNQLVLRPVPDAGYKISIAGYRLPTELINSSASPEIKNWWEMIAVGAALKIFTDRREVEELNQYLPIYKRLESEAINRTVEQQTNQRSATIYSDMYQGVNRGFFNYR